VGLSLFVYRLARAPAAAKAAVAACFSAGATIGDLVGGVPGAMFGVIVAILPAYLALLRVAVPQKSYSLFMPAAEGNAGLRDWKPLALAALIEKLERHGFQLAIFALDSSGRTATPLDGSALLLGPAMRLQMKGMPHWRGGVTMRLPDGAGGIGGVDVIDEPSGRYCELAQFAIVAIGELVPGTTFKESFSSLSPESTGWLAAQLPDRNAGSR
jgi:hypothetical protein